MIRKRRMGSCSRTSLANDEVAATEAISASSPI